MIQINKKDLKRNILSVSQLRLKDIKEKGVNRVKRITVSSQYLNSGRKKKEIEDNRLESIFYSI